MLHGVARLAGLQSIRRSRLPRTKLRQDGFVLWVRVIRMVPRIQGWMADSSCEGGIAARMRALREAATAKVRAKSRHAIGKSPGMAAIVAIPGDSYFI